MQFTEFRSHEPLVHLPRALDQLSRMGFSLVSLDVRPSGAGCVRVRIEYLPAGALVPDILAQRLRQLHGLEGLIWGSVEETMPDEAASDASALKTRVRLENERQGGAVIDRGDRCDIFLVSPRTGPRTFPLVAPVKHLAGVAAVFVLELGAPVPEALERQSVCLALLALVQQTAAPAIKV